MPLHDQNSWRPSTIAESRIGTMNRWAFLGAPASRRRVDVSRGKQHASGTLALPGSWKEEGVLSFLSSNVTRRDLSHELRRSHRVGVFRPVRAGHPALSAETAAAARRGLDLDVLVSNPARRTNRHFHYP